VIFPKPLKTIKIEQNVIKTIKRALPDLIMQKFA